MPFSFTGFGGILTKTRPFFFSDEGLSLEHGERRVSQNSYRSPGPHKRRVLHPEFYIEYGVDFPFDSFSQRRGHHLH